MKANYFLIMILSFLLSGFISTGAQNSPSIIWKNLNSENTFMIEKQGKSTHVTRKSLKFTYTELKPETVPQYDDQAEWIV